MEQPYRTTAGHKRRTLVVGAPADIASWVRDRFGRLIAGCAERAGCELPLAEEPKRRALRRSDGHAGAVGALAPAINQMEVS